MDKPFDFDVLKAGLKEDGLDVGEIGVRKLVERVYGWTEKSVKLTPTLVDDMVFRLFPDAHQMLLKEIDKIDGKVSL